MQEKASQIKVINIYKENNLTLTKLIQQWLNENYFFWNLNNNK